MDLGVPLIEYDLVDIDDLRQAMKAQSASYWEIDQVNRAALAGSRPGNAVFFYNDKPAFARKRSMDQLQSGVLNVLRYGNRPLFREVDAIIQNHIKPKFPDCDPIRVQLAELPPREVISPHRDMHILTKMHRLHIPIVTHEDVVFIIQGRRFYLEPGRLYDLNNAVEHSVENNSDVMRIHLLVDMLPNKLARATYHDSESAMRSVVG
ncbi:MAG: aspartyl/asparaginyl beta-hydroxylase domain-containing protein [Alphaproteobacteria bacterium]|nr:aspartyl/asparaginyl beta-hydroxylase domain-containing protein [Alphaproteobacteria bacterium]MBU0803084.1 aspartyl/asparaginyl beta-hydroxylase domain-containing protein [Alphaproteobacteria bacterium]MBU0873772.1 aspartyl/asparaginyl beta-hydroxylase domain-containing protein [Alphaproteobacteria bacterium]MBU1400728.1 aspartyl/asparaginyl beta-hydroxylase domain-containing protein [Alphaproteobacteria bacterium]MBU1590601.1 aspartyl/asparaginyl beta-hydroxylase domain-containing protein 